MLTRVVIGLMGTALLLAGMTGLVAGLDGPSDPGAGEVRKPVHADAAATEKQLLAAISSLMRNDAAAARKALDGLEKQCRRLDSYDADEVGPDIVSVDRAYHKALDRTREHAGAGEVDDAFDAFFWVQRSCRECHAVAIDSGLLPAEGPLW